MVTERQQAPAPGIIRAGAPNTRRKRIHTRRVTCAGYARDDGMLDIEGEMQDITPEATELLFKLVPAGGLIHSMRLIVTVDMDLVIHAATAYMDTAPTEFCPEIVPAYDALVGLRIGPGFRQQVRARLGGVRGCTHLTELLGPIGTTAVQARAAFLRSGQKRQRPAEGHGLMPRPALTDGCHTYRLDGEAMEVLWPRHRRAAAGD